MFIFSIEKCDRGYIVSHKDFKDDKIVLDNIMSLWGLFLGYSINEGELEYNAKCIQSLLRTKNKVVKNKYKFSDQTINYRCKII